MSDSQTQQLTGHSANSRIAQENLSDKTSTENGSTIDTTTKMRVWPIDVVARRDSLNNQQEAADLADEAHTRATVPALTEDGPSALFPLTSHQLTTPSGAAPSEAKLRVENLHYELLEPEVRELFSRIGPVLTVQLLYDRHDRTTGTAFVTYHSVSDARAAVRDFDGANAYGQPIRVTLLPPSDARPAGGRNPFDNVEKPSRSLFERIDAGGEERSPDRRGRGRGRRSESPGRSRRDGEIDRYVPGSRGRERSPIRRRGTPRESGRRPGERTRGGRGGRRTDEAGRPVVGGRPKKTQEELDAEMNDYWGGDKGAQNGKVEDGAEQTAPAHGEGDVEIDLMVE